MAVDRMVWRDQFSKFRVGHSFSYNLLMAKYLDIANWARRDLFEFFRSYDNPYFNICTSLDITNLIALLQEHPLISVSLTFHYFALRVANEIEPFRYRLSEGRVLVHEVINGGTTVLLPNESFTFAYFDYDEEFHRFIEQADQRVRDAKTGNNPFVPSPGDDKIHFTTFPWASFTSFQHARNWGREDSVPKIAFGKFTTENGRTLLPISVEVHHALMDGIHVGKYLTKLQDALSEPEKYLSRE
jgi:chloramphenicol O-acetyltransferase type A